MLRCKSEEDLKLLSLLLIMTAIAFGVSAYSAQQHVLLQTLTVRNTLRSAAGLRLLHPATIEERQNDVECHPEARLKGVRSSKAGNRLA